jgi:uncharacterized membrane protein
MLKIGSRPSLFVIAGLGLALAHASNFLLLNKNQSSACSLIGNVLFFVALLAVIRSTERSEEERTTATKAATVVSCIIAICLLPTSAFVLTPHWLHGLLSIAAFGSMFFCWSLPSSGWTALTLLPIYAIALIHTKWNMFPELLKIPIWTWITMCLAWIFITLLVFRWIDRRQANASAQD